jgi:hypothetical protein
VSRCRDGLRKFLNPRARLGAESRVHMNPQAVLEPPPLQRSAPRAPPQRCTAARAPAALIRPRRRRARGGGGAGFVRRRELCAQVQTGGGPSPSAHRARHATDRRGTPAPRRLRGPGGRRQRAARERGRFFLRFVRFFLRFVRFFLCVFRGALCKPGALCAAPGAGAGAGPFSRPWQTICTLPCASLYASDAESAGSPADASDTPCRGGSRATLRPRSRTAVRRCGRRGGRGHSAHRERPSVEPEHGVSD